MGPRRTQTEDPGEWEGLHQALLGTPIYFYLWTTRFEGHQSEGHEEAYTITYASGFPEPQS